MRKNLNVIAAYSIMMGLIILVGIFQSWNIALSIFNLCLISAVMTMGANIQWGYAGLINFGTSNLFSEKYSFEVIYSSSKTKDFKSIFSPVVGDLLYFLIYLINGNLS